MSWKTFLFYDCNLEMLDFWRKSKQFLYKTYTNEYAKSSHRGLVVSMSDGRFRSGGLGDRLHGIISLYMYCKDRGYKFKANFCEPFRLNEYLEPNEYDWNINPQDLCYDRTGAVPIIMPISHFIHGGNQATSSFMLKYLDKIIRKDSMKEYHVYTNMHYAFTPEVYSKIFHVLFKPSKELSDAIEWNKSRIGNKYISVTLRFQNLLGDFYEGKFPTLEKEGQDSLMQKVKNKIEDLHSRSHPKEKILITSDSRRFLDYVNDLDYVYTIPGKIVHMSYTPTHDFETHLKSFVDLMMLADANKLYLLVTDQMYKSGFAESASFINNHPYEVVYF